MKILFLFFFCYISCVFAKPLSVDINAKNAILINAKNNTILFEKKAYQKAYPASLTKIMTICYVLEKHKQDLNKYFKASANALTVVKPEKKIGSNYSLKPYILETDGSHFYMIRGERLTLNDLLHGMMISSGNDASNVVAEGFYGSIETFMQKVNHFLLDLGCRGSFLCNPHGLHVPDQVSTASDISKVMRFAINNQKFLELFGCKFYVRPKTNKQQKKEFVTRNQLLKPGKHYYKYAIGSKTGYHSKAKHNLVSVATKNDRTLIAVVLGCKTVKKKYEDTKKLFDAAFAEKKSTKQILDKNKLFLAKIEGGTKVLKANLKEDLNVDIYPSEKTPLKALVLWDNVKLPIKKGQKVASIAVQTKDNEIIKKQDIYATHNLKKTFFFMLKEFFKKS